MAQTTITIPDFSYSGIYYPDLLVMLRQFARINVPEITDESDEEPATQLLRAMALVGHLNNTLLDIVANETLMPTARLLESVRNHLKLIDVQLSQATPSTADVIYELSKVFTVSTLLVPTGTQTSTESDATIGQILFETLEDFSIEPTNSPSKVFTFQSGYIEVVDNSFEGGDTIIINGVNFVFSVDWVAGATTDDSAQNILEAILLSTDPNVQGRVSLVRRDSIIYLLPDNSSVTSITVSKIDNVTTNFNIRSMSYSSDLSGTFSTVGLLNTMFSSDPRPFDALYVMHSSIEWDQFDFEFDTVGSGIRGAFEFYDGSYDDAKPDSVTNLGPNLSFVVNGLVSPNEITTLNREGTRVRVTLNSTGAFEDVYSQFDGTNNYITTLGLLGQSTVSTSADSYTIGTLWNPVTGEVDDTIENNERFGDSDSISFDLPDNLSQNWIKNTVNGEEGYWLRFRITNISGAKATGSLDFIAAGVGIGIEDGDTVVISDGAGNTDVYEFDSDSSVTLGNIAVTIGVSATPSQVKTAFLAAVVGGSANVTYSDGGSNLVNIENNVVGVAGNVAIIESISNSQSLSPVGMSNGENIPVVPIVNILRIDGGSQYLKTQQVQGETKTEDPLGSSNGLADQQFTLTYSPLIEGSLVLEVDDGSGFSAYNKVDNFLNSGPSSKDYLLDITAENVATITFGDGTQGKIPANGVDNIKATYRIGADVNGNVGSGTIKINSSGIAFIRRVFNPRQAIGWTAKEGSTEEDLARIKIEGPATLRSKAGGITLPDFEFLTRQYVSSTGSKVVERALGIEETFGIKTIEIVVAGFGGTFLTDDLREEIEDYFNGNKEQEIEAKGLTNHEVTVVNYTPEVIDVEVEITTTLTEVAPFENVISDLLSPSAKFDDGVTFRWDYGGLVPRAIIIAELFAVNETLVKNVKLTTPADDIQLGTRSLPVAGNITVNLVEP